MRILEVMSQMMFRGGGEVFFASLATKLEKSEDVYCLILHGGIHPSFAALEERFKGRFFTCHKRNGLDLRAAKRFKEIVNAVHPDIVHSHCQCISTYFIAFGVRKTSFLYFHTLHSVAKKEAPIYDRTLKKILIKHNRLSLIAISPAIAKTAEHVYRTKPTIIPNGIDETPYVSMKAKQQWNGNFICVAGFRPVKNHELLVRGFAELKKRGHPFRLVCCGGGETLEVSIQLAKTLDIDKETTFTGWIDNATPYLIEANCFVLASHYEGSPLSVIEGLSCALPCIAPDVGGIPDLLNGGNGILFKPENPESLADALEFFYLHPDLYPAYSEKALQSAKKHGMVECARVYIETFKWHLENRKI